MPQTRVWVESLGKEDCEEVELKGTLELLQVRNSEKTDCPSWIFRLSFRDCRVDSRRYLALDPVETEIRMC